MSTWFAHDPVYGAYWIASDPTAATIPTTPPGGGHYAWPGFGAPPPRRPVEDEEALLLAILH